MERLIESVVTKALINKVYDYRMRHECELYVKKDMIGKKKLPPSFIVTMNPNWYL